VPITKVAPNIIFYLQKYFHIFRSLLYIFQILCLLLSSLEKEYRKLKILFSGWVHLSAKASRYHVGRAHCCRSTRSHHPLFSAHLLGELSPIAPAALAIRACRPREHHSHHFRQHRPAPSSWPLAPRPPVGCSLRHLSASALLA
jgi:hypothetical protein